MRPTVRACSSRRTGRTPRATRSSPARASCPNSTRVSIEPGHAPDQILTTPALAAHYNKAGDKIVYEDLKGYENLWRKHEKTSVTHDIWLWDAKTGTHTQLTTYLGEDRNPVFSSDEKSVLYLSEQGGSYNVWKLDLANPPHPTQVTHFTRNPGALPQHVRRGRPVLRLRRGNLSLAQRRDRTEESFHQDRFWRQRAQGGGRGHERRRDRDSAHPDGKEIAFVAHGEVFVASTEHGDTKRIPAVTTQERT